MILKKIEIKNLKKIKDLKTDFEGAVYLVKGENETGKSTLLSTIIALITGDRSKNLLTEGEKKGFAKAEIEADNGKKFQVQISFTDKNPYGTIKITDPYGMTSNNKNMLQQIFDYKDLDVNEFVKMSDTAEGRRKQVETIENLLPPDQRKAIRNLKNLIAENKESRKEVNAKCLELQKLVNSSQFSKEEVKKYSKPKPVEEVNAKLSEAIKTNQKIEGVKERFQSREVEMLNFDEKYTLESRKKYQELEDLKAAVKAKEKEIQDYVSNSAKEKDELRAKQAQAEKFLSDTKPVDLKSIENEQKEAQEHNIKHFQVIEFLERLKKYQTAKSEKETLENSITEAKENLENLIKACDLPIEGLRFDDDGLTLNGIPFKSGEVSTSQEMMLAISVIMATNQKTKIFRLSQGESLGSDKLKALVQFATEKGYQGFIEEVTRGQEEMTIEEYKIEE